ncbi:MAG: hypothetical protein ACTSRU_21720 [Candidatus Hodarchaeales archaeon]
MTRYQQSRQHLFDMIERGEIIVIPKKDLEDELKRNKKLCDGMIDKNRDEFMYQYGKRVVLKGLLHGRLLGQGDKK